MRRKQPSPSEAHIQRLRPAIPGHRLVLLVRSKAYGSEGLEPVDDRDCPYFQQHGYSNSCISGSGGSMCGGFFGATSDGYTRCTWLPRWTLRGQEFEVLPADDSDPRQQRATWN